MADAVITTVLDRPPNPKIPTQKVRKAEDVEFLDGDTQSQIFEKMNLDLIGFTFPTFTTAVSFSFLVANQRSGTFRPLANVEIDITAEGADSTAFLAEWPFYRIVLNTVETGEDRTISVTGSQV